MLATRPIEMMLAALFFGLLLLAVVNDVESLRIPNRISAALAGLFPLHVVLSPQPVDWPAALLVAALVFAVGVAAFAFGLFGGGDVKLLAACALWVGEERVVAFLALTALIGGGLALIMLGRWRTVLAALADRCGAEVVRDALLRPFIPYGVAIAGAAALSAYDLVLMPAARPLGGS